MAAAEKGSVLRDFDQFAALSETTDIRCLTGMRPSGKLHLGHYV